MTTIETRDADDEAGAKLIPEWEVDADDQVIVAGVAVFVVLALLVGWSAWRSGDDEVASVASSIIAQPSVEEAGAVLGTTEATVTTAAPATTGVDTNATSATVAPSTTAAASAAIGDGQAAVVGLPRHLPASLADLGDASLTAVGNGETDQFAAGDAPAALQANRVVLFEQTG